MKRRETKWGVVVAALALVWAISLGTSQAAAQTVNATWNDGNGNWSTVADWNCPAAGQNCVPNNVSGTFYDAVIDTASPVTVTLDQNATLDSLHLGSNPGLLATPANVLDIGIAGTPETLALGSTNADADLEVGSNGVVNIADGSTLQVNVKAGETVSYDNDGAINIGAGGLGGTAILNGSGSTFDIYSDNCNQVTGACSGVITLNANSQIKGATGAEFLVNDSGETLEGVGSVNNLTLSNYGTIEANTAGGTLTISPAAIVYDSNGNYVSGGFWNYGEVDVSAGSTLAVTGGVGSTSGGYLSGFGNLFEGELGTFGFGMDTYKISGVFNYGGGPSNTISQVDSDTAIVLNGSGALMTPDGTTNGLKTLNTLNGSLTLSNGGTVGGTLASLTLGSVGSLEVDGNTTLAATTFTNLSGGMLSGGSYTIGGTFQYGGGNTNTISTIGANTSVTLIGSNNFEGTTGGAALMTHDGTTNGLASLSTIASGGSLILEGGGAANLSLGQFTNNGFLNVEEQTTLTTAGLTNLQNGVLTGGSYEVGGTYQYGGGSGNTIKAMGLTGSYGNYTTVRLDGDNGGVTLMTPDGTTNGLGTLETIGAYPG